MFLHNGIFTLKKINVAFTFGLDLAWYHSHWAQDNGNIITVYHQDFEIHGFVQHRSPLNKLDCATLFDQWGMSHNSNLMLLVCIVLHLSALMWKPLYYVRMWYWAALLLRMCSSNTLLYYSSQIPKQLWFLKYILLSHYHQNKQIYTFLEAEF